MGDKFGRKNALRDAMRAATLTLRPTPGRAAFVFGIHDHSEDAQGGQNLRQIEELEFDNAGELMLDAAGATTRMQVYHSVDTYGDADTDDLVTINGGVEGDQLIIRAENSARTVVVKHGTGNIRLVGGNDVSLDDVTDHLALICDGTYWNPLGGLAATALGSTPGLTYSATNAEGTAPSFVRTDATIDIFDAIVPTTIQPDDAAATGSVAHAARRDHKHAIICGTPSDIGNANAEGSSTQFVRLDHVHDHPAGLGVNLHHNQSHVLATNVALGPDHIVSGATTGHVLRASGAATALFAQLQHSDLGGVGANDHHTEVHVVNSTGPHAEGGLTVGHALRASGAATFAFAQLQHGDLGGVGAGDHHDAVTLAADADVLLGLSTQQITLDSQAANTVFAGPAAGGAADPTFRALVTADLPSSAVRGSGANTQVAYWTGANTQAGDAGLTYNAATDTLTIAGDILMADDHFVGITGDIRIEFDETDGDIMLHLGDAAGADEVQVIDSGGGVVAYVDSDGNADFEGHLAVGAGASVNTDHVIQLSETTNIVAGTFIGQYSNTRVDPSADFNVWLYGYQGQIYLAQSGAAFARTGGVMIGVAGTCLAGNGVAHTGLYMYGGQFYTDVEDASATVAYGLLVGTPNVDTGACTVGYGMRIGQGVVGAGSITTLYGIYLDAITTGNTNYAIYSAGGNSYHAGSVTVGSGSDVDPTDASGQNLGDATHRWDLYTQEIHFGGVTANNVITVPDNVANALYVTDDGDGDIYFGIRTVTGSERVVFNAGGDDVDFIVQAVGHTDALQVQGSDGQITLGVLTAGYVESSAGGVLSVAAEVPLVDLGSYTQGDLIYGGAGDWQDLAHPGAANRVLQSTAAEVGWSANAVTFPAAGAVPVGSGADTQIAYWTAANTLAGDAGLTYAAATDTLTITAATALTNTVKDNLVLEHTTSGTAAANFGAGLLYKLEDAGGVSRDAMRTAVVWQSAVVAQVAEFQLLLNYSGILYDAGIVVGATSVAGNQRGVGAVDWQVGRNAATQIASGGYAFLGGGRRNTANAAYTAILGGFGNVGGGTGSLAMGYYAKTDKRGEFAQAAGYFAAAGDAQLVRLVARRMVTHSDALWYNLYLDGASAHITIPINTVWAFDVRITGTTQGGGAGMDVFGYGIHGVIENDNGTTALKASSVTVYYEDDADFAAQAVGDNANDALLIQVRDSTSGDATVRWDAIIGISQVTYP